MAGTATSVEKEMMRARDPWEKVSSEWPVGAGKEGMTGLGAGRVVPQ